MNTKGFSDNSSESQSEHTETSVKAKIIIYCLRALALLPLGALYILSDIAYIILYKIVGYRRKVVRENLRLAFPDKSESELKNI